MDLSVHKSLACYQPEMNRDEVLSQHGPIAVISKIFKVISHIVWKYPAISKPFDVSWYFQIIFLRVIWGSELIWKEDMSNSLLIAGISVHSVASPLHPLIEVSAESSVIFCN